jgi:hypothetical protein
MSKINQTHATHEQGWTLIYDERHQRRSTALRRIPLSGGAALVLP